MSEKNASRVRRAAVVAGLTAVAALGLSAQPASAAVAHNIGQHTVCAQTLTEYDTPGGHVVGRSIFQDKFTIIEFASGGYVRGYAWNGQLVYVINGYFC